MECFPPSLRFLSSFHFLFLKESVKIQKLYYETKVESNSLRGFFLMINDFAKLLKSFSSYQFINILDMERTLLTIWHE